MRLSGLVIASVLLISPLLQAQHPSAAGSSPTPTPAASPASSPPSPPQPEPGAKPKYDELCHGRPPLWQLQSGPQPRFQ
jgi:hypothetical protein